jgi:PLP dependent protein
MSTIAENIVRVKERIDRAAQKSRRNPEEIRLIAVSKTVEEERVLQAIEAGVEIFGENYVQEAQRKIEALGHPVAWHLIGHLQTNKAKLAAGLFDTVHSVDSIKLAGELNRWAKQQGRILPILLQVHLSGEGTKFGAREEEIWEMAEKCSALDGIRVRGLMTMPPYFEDPEEARPYFIKLREIGERLASKKIPGISTVEYSMGMSNDFEVAVEEGATMVRVGTAIFGPRQQK